MGVGNIIKGTVIPKEESQERLRICNSCPKKNMIGMCSVCGCIVRLKTKYREEQCPIQKW